MGRERITPQKSQFPPAHCVVIGRIEERQRTYRAYCTMPLVGSWLVKGTLSGSLLVMPVETPWGWSWEASFLDEDDIEAAAMRKGTREVVGLAFVFDGDLSVRKPWHIQLLGRSLSGENAATHLAEPSRPMSVMQTTCCAGCCERRESPGRVLGAERERVRSGVERGRSSMVVQCVD